MILVVDTNVIVAATIRPTITQTLIFRDSFTLYSPEFVKDEIEKHQNEIMKKGGFSKEEFETIISLLYSQINIVPSKEYIYLKEDILKFSPDKKDWPFLALAKHLDAALWSNDSALKKQNVVKILTTAELLELSKK
ncbi:MAG: PIN domain-containing protein [Candidatus Micrarchaeota archaeon]